MDHKNYTQVLIDGKIYTLGGSEEEAYLQKAASYVNDKSAQLRRLPGFSKQNADYQMVMTELNIADDYFKAMEWAERMERQKNDMEKETYSLKHELVSTQMKLEAVLKDLEERQKELDRLTRAMAQMEGELIEVRSGYESLKKNIAAGEALARSKPEVTKAQDNPGALQSQDHLAAEESGANQGAAGEFPKLRLLSDIETVAELDITEDVDIEVKAIMEAAADTENTEASTAAAATTTTPSLSDEELARRALKAAKKANSHRGGRR